jgi:hypothetical protein
MRVSRWLVLSALALTSLVTRAAGAQEAGSLEITEAIDDPKLERRLGTRVELSAAPDQSRDRLGRRGGAGGARCARAASGRGPPASHGAEPRVPHLKLGYRWFTFAQVLPDGAGGTGPDETFHVISLDFYPSRRSGGSACRRSMGGRTGRSAPTATPSSRNRCPSEARSPGRSSPPSSKGTWAAA